MERDVIPLHSSSPPPLDDAGDGEAGSEEDEFGDFGGFAAGLSRSPTGFGSADWPPSLRCPSPAAAKPATRQPKCSFNHPVEQPQPASAANSESSGGRVLVEGQDCDTESRVHFMNGHCERDPSPRARAAAAVGACPPREETGFADFTVFTEQAAHPWCCGFSPLDGAGRWDARVTGTNSSNGLGEQTSGSGQEVVMDSEPRSHCACKAKGNLGAMEHCEKRDAALVRPPQDRRRPQEAAAALDFPSEEEEEEEKEKEFGKCGDGQRERRRSHNSLQSREMPLDEEAEEDGEDEEESFSALPQTLSVYESASEDLASQCDDLSFEGPSADLEPNTSSLASQDDQTDDEDEDAGRHMHSDSSVNTSTANVRQSTAEKGFHYCDQSATQETSATSNQSQPGAHTEDSFADFPDGRFEPRGGPGRAADAGLQSLGNLPPSDSFADFCSAPAREDGEDGEEAWAEFREQRAQEEGRAWTQLREQASSLQAAGGAGEEEQHGAPPRSSCQASLSCRVRQLLLASFPEVEVPAVEGEEEVLSLCALIHARRLPVSEEVEEEEKIPEQCPRSYWVQQEMWWPHQDLDGAVGLQFQWGGSHANRTLLRCLGVDTRNIVFIGMKKQPVAVPAFALSLGMLEPTKDSVPASCPPGHTAVTAQAPLEPRDTPDPSPDSAQEALPSRQPDWSSRGLSNSQDGCSALNLDYFGPVEESKSCSSSSSTGSRSSSPPPGVDRELYELTTSRLDSSTPSSHVEDTLNRLMSTAEKTSTTSVRKPQQDEELSAEAATVISQLPSLSFMQAKVLMFPSILTPTERRGPNLQ